MIEKFLFDDVNVNGFPDEGKILYAVLLRYNDVREKIRLNACPVCLKKFKNRRALKIHLAKADSCRGGYRIFINEVVDRYLLIRKSIKRYGSNKHSGFYLDLHIRLKFPNKQSIAQFIYDNFDFVISNINTF